MSDPITTRRTRGYLWFMDWTTRKWQGINARHMALSVEFQSATNSRRNAILAEGRILIAKGQKFIDARTRAGLNAWGVKTV